jgi:hypothetical protein
VRLRKAEHTILDASSGQFDFERFLAGGPEQRLTDRGQTTLTVSDARAASRKRLVSIKYCVSASPEFASRRAGQTSLP